MKSYPSIPHVKGYHNQPCTAFYKYDGSNIRAEWSKKRGWYKFGTRTRLFDQTDEVFGGAIELFKNTYGSDLEKVFKDNKTFKGADQVMAFCEFFGPKSFAGQHDPADPKQLVLFDVNIHKKGLLDPRQFTETFGHLKVAEVVYQGILTEEFEQQVRSGQIPGLVEGVIAKGGTGHKIWMCKIKTDTYREKLKKQFADQWEKYWE